ncbi:MAG: XRE family transcriptional regulator [Clostridia bacterium]|nr:XRE family transcriptional regulator [Clostridia bacterium]
MLDAKILGERIKELRKQRGLTQSAFADDMSVSFQAVSNWERGIAPPDLDNLIRIADYFNLLIDDLVRHSPTPLVLAVDAGGTKTELAVTDLDGHVLGTALKKGSNPNDIGREKALELICEAIHEMLIQFPSVRAIFCGVAGITSGDNRRYMLSALKKKYPSIEIDVENDAANLFPFSDRADMALISGTGSVAFIKRDDSLLRIGGWGYLFDSAGSAYDIGRDAIAASLYLEDAKKQPSVMAKMLRKRLGTPDIWSAVSDLYAGGKPYIASLADTVFEAYAENDPDAVSIIEKSARHLGELLELGVNTYKAKPCAVASGGIFEHHSKIMLERIKEYTDTEVILCDLPPIYGACRIARGLLEKDCHTDFYSNFKNSYRREVN